MSLTGTPIYQKGQGKKKARSPMRKVSAKKSAQKSSPEGRAAREYMGYVKLLPCVICGKWGPSDAHHCFHDRYGTSKESDWDVIPLCKLCHQDGPEAIHKIKRTWMEMHGPDHGFISQVAEDVLRRFGFGREEYVKKTGEL